jgi:NAD+ kinase
VTPGNVRKLSGPIQKIGVVLRRRTSDVAEIVARLVTFSESRGVALLFEGGSPDVPSGAQALDLEHEPVDLLLSLGGDGTMLRAARLGMPQDIPVFGVNLGRLGFLTATPAKDLEVRLGEVLDGGAQIDRRFTIEAVVVGRDGKRSEPFEALNDIVVHTAGAARVTALNLSVGRTEGREEIGSISADGVILATPTGSTAYSLSAGGPIIVPEVECFVVTPICPHSLAVRPLVLPAHEQIMVRSLDPGAKLQLTVDGQVVRAVGPGEVVSVVRGSSEVSLVRVAGQTFFGTMSSKLNWAARPPERT